MNKSWICVGPSEKFHYGLNPIVVENQRLIIGILDGEVFAFDAFCPHGAGPMECAEVEGAIVTCPLHGWRFDLGSAGSEIHGYRGIRTLNVKIDKGQLYIELESDQGISSSGIGVTDAAKA